MRTTPPAHSGGVTSEADIGLRRRGRRDWRQMCGHSTRAVMRAPASRCTSLRASGCEVAEGASSTTCASRPPAGGAGQAFKIMRSTAVGIGDRRMPQPGVAGLPAGGLGPPRGQRRREGRVPHQPRGRGVAVGARGDGTGHLPTVSRAGAQGAHRVLPLQGAGLPRRQRLRVHQPQGRRDAQPTARPRVHQVPQPAHQRQRPGREQERQRDPAPLRIPCTSAQALRPRDQRLRTTMCGTPFLNVHRPCLFPNEFTDSLGRTSATLPLPGPR